MCLHIIQLLESIDWKEVININKNSLIKVYDVFFINLSMLFRTDEMDLVNCLLVTISFI